MNHELSEYTVTVALTKGRNIAAVATFDKAQAEIGLDLLNHSYDDRVELGHQLKRCLASVRPIADIYITTKSQMGIITRPTIPLKWRVALLLSKALLSNNTAGQEALRDCLSKVVRGTHQNNVVVKPFLYPEIPPKKGEM